MDTKGIVADCVNYIEENMYQKVQLDDLAQHTGVSKYHLHRIFKALTGDSIMEYAQARKLSASVGDLVNTDLRMIDIALNYGFDYEQSYIRAFRKRFGCTPLKARSGHSSILLKEKMNLHDVLSVNNSVTCKPFFVFKQKFQLIGKKHKILSKSGDNVANAHGKAFFYSERESIVNPLNPQEYFGYTDWSGNNEGYIYYIPSVQVKDLNHVPEGFTGITIPAHKYVVFRFVGFFRPDEIKGRQVGRLLVQMYSKWIFKSGFKFADTFRFEYINMELCKDNYCELDIYQPIVEI